LPELKNILGPSWRRIDYDVNGEWGLYLVLDQFLANTIESKRATAGWGGDRFAIYETATPGETFIAQLTAWDTPLDAKEFFEAYAKRTAKRYPEANATAETAEHMEWQTANGAVAMELRGSQVAILEGLPQQANANQLFRLIWKQR